MAAIVYESKLRRFEELVNGLEKGTPLRSQFQNILKEAEDRDLGNAIDDLTEALLKCRVFSFSRDATNRKGCLMVPLIPELIFRLRMKSQLKSIMERLKKLGEIKTFPREKVYGSLDSSWPADQPNLVGFDDVQNKLRQKLIDGSPISTYRFIGIAIVGTGGSGKTALAQKLFNSFGYEEFEIKIWVSMSKHLYSKKDYKSILLTILDQLPNSNSNSKNEELTLLMKIVREKLENKNYLIVLDGVHHVEDWVEHLGNDVVENLSGCLPKGSGNGAVIVSTREEEAAEKMVGGKNIYRMETMKDDECWKIFQNSFGEVGHHQDSLNRIKEDICNDCKGLPLVAKALGTIVRRSELATHRWD